MKTYEVRPFLSAPIDEQEEADFECFNLYPLDEVLAVTAGTFAEAVEKARDYIARELEKRGLRVEKNEKSEAVDAYDGDQFVCEFYGFDEP